MHAVRACPPTTPGKLPLVSRPVAIMHGTADELVPWQHGQRLFQAAARPVPPLWLEGSGHNDLPPVTKKLAALPFCRSYTLPAPLTDPDIPVRVTRTMT